MSDKLGFQKRVLFVGIPDMACVCLEGLFNAGVNIVGVMGPKKSHETYAYFKSLVEQKNLNFIEWDNLSSPDLIKKLSDLNLDVAVVASFNYKIPKVLLNVPKDGFINIHPSLLPDYRGGNPYSAVIINGEKETGVSLHFMDECFDTGDIIMQKRIQILPHETMGSLFNCLNSLGTQMLLDVLTLYEHRELPRFKQPKGNFILGNSINGKDTFIDFNKSAKYIERFIRALNPFVCATSIFKNINVRIFTANCIEADDENDLPCGAITKVTDDTFYIKTGNGLIEPVTLQFGSYFIGTAKNFIQVVKPKVGEEFYRWTN